MINLNAKEAELLGKYQEIYHSNPSPDWAYQFKPPIIFIGDHFEKKNKRVLVYASAENITGALRNPQFSPNLASLQETIFEELQWVRHRYFYEEYRSNDPNSTDIGIQPVENKYLLVVTRYLLKLLGFEQEFTSNHIPSILNEIAVGNFCKYSIKNERNIDYANSRKKLRESLKYVEADLIEVRPDILVIPRTIYNNIWDLVDNVVKKQLSMKIIPIYQVNQTVINCHLSKKISGRHIPEDCVKMAKYKDDKVLGNLDKYLFWLMEEFEQHLK